MALRDVEEEPGQRLGLEGLLVLYQRLVEATEREELLALGEVPLGGPGRGVLLLASTLV